MPMPTPRREAEPNRYRLHSKLTWTLRLVTSPGPLDSVRPGFFHIKPSGPLQIPHEWGVPFSFPPQAQLAFGELNDLSGAPNVVLFATGVALVARTTQPSRVRRSRAVSERRLRGCCFTRVRDPGVL